VSVADQLPKGWSLQAAVPKRRFRCGWTCAIADGAVEFTCRREAGKETLAPGEEYSPIVMHVRVNAAAVSSVTNSATVYGGGASPASATAGDPTTIAPAGPFGIQSFTTTSRAPR